MLTLVIGSLLLPITLGMLHGGLNDVFKAYTQEAYIIPMAALIGFLASIPSLITMLIAGLVIRNLKIKNTCAIGAFWILNSLLILITIMLIIGFETQHLKEVLYFSLPYVMANSLFYAYHRFKPYRKPQVLNFPI